jgi:hypothetical protein
MVLGGSDETGEDEVLGSNGNCGVVAKWLRKG